MLLQKLRWFSAAIVAAAAFAEPCFSQAIVNLSCRRENFGAGWNAPGPDCMISVGNFAQVLTGTADPDVTDTAFTTPPVGSDTNATANLGSLAYSPAHGYATGNNLGGTKNSIPFNAESTNPSVEYAGTWFAHCMPFSQTAATFATARISACRTRGMYQILEDDTVNTDGDAGAPVTLRGNIDVIVDNQASPVHWAQGAPPTVVVRIAGSVFNITSLDGGVTWRIQGYAQRANSPANPLFINNGLGTTLFRTTVTEEFDIDDTFLVEVYQQGPLPMTPVPPEVGAPMDPLPDGTPVAFLSNVQSVAANQQDWMKFAISIKVWWTVEDVEQH